MSKVKNDSDLSGVFGNRVTFRKVAGKVEALNRATRKMPPANPAQLVHQEKFKQAAKYAKAQMADPTRVIEYAAAVTAKLKTAFLVALSDYLLAPAVKAIDTIEYGGKIGDKIEVKATDDFKVARVKVAIEDRTGVQIETGEAVQDPLAPENWTYAATAANPALPGTKIIATAFDLPKNSASLERVL